MSREALTVVWQRRQPRACRRGCPLGCRRLGRPRGHTATCRPPGVRSASPSRTAVRRPIHAGGSSRGASRRHCPTAFWPGRTPYARRRRGNSSRWLAKRYAMTRGMRCTVAWRPAPIGARRPVTGWAPNQRGPRCTALAWGKRVGSATSTGETDPRFSRTSWLPDAARCARAVRPHGPMANGVHGVLEVSCRADDCRLRTEQGPETLAV